MGLFIKPTNQPMLLFKSHVPVVKINVCYCQNMDDIEVFFKNLEINFTHNGYD